MLAKRAIWSAIKALLNSAENIRGILVLSLRKPEKLRDDASTPDAGVELTKRDRALRSVSHLLAIA